jgi:hypothetical protein
MAERLMSKDDRARVLRDLIFPTVGLVVLILFAWFLYQVANGALDS